MFNILRRILKKKKRPVGKKTILNHVEALGTDYVCWLGGVRGKTGKTILEEAVLRPREGLIGVLRPFKGSGVQRAILTVW